jgi:hypothetical protein
VYRSLIVVLLCCIAPASAEERPTSAHRYGAADWPAASAVRAGFDTGALKATGLERVSLRIDARRAEATLGFRPRATPKGQLEQPREAAVKGPTVVVKVRRFATCKQARRWLLAELGACQAKLTREPGLGDVAFGWRRAQELRYAAAAQGNLGWVVRSLNPGPAAAVGEGPGDVALLAAALDAQARRAPKIGASKGPQLLGHEVGVAQIGKPLPFSLRFAPAAHSLRFDAGEHASVVRARSGFLLYADRSGKVEVTVYACTRDLQASKHQVVLHTR